MPRKKKTSDLNKSPNSDEVKIDDLFKVQHSTNAIIDGELNRIWGYLKLKQENENKIKELYDTLDRINEDIQKYKENANKEEVKESDNVDIKSIIEKVSSELFNSSIFMEKLSEEIVKELKKKNNIDILFNGNDIKSARFEFGFAKKGKVVFFNKAFQNVLWHLPNEMSLVTNTGFVSLKDSFWIVVGEDSDN